MLSLAEIAEKRLESQQLKNTVIQTAQNMVKWFVAVQGQEYAQSKWGLGLRLLHVKDSDIEQELTEGRILRIHILRPTWHFISSTDIHWLLDLSAPRIRANNATMLRRLEIDTSLLNKCFDILIKVLRGGRYLSRNALNEAFGNNGIEARGHRLGYIMMNAELEGIICSGPREGNQFTYALLDERVKTSVKYSREEALTELARRYFMSRGPATLKDFSTWSGLTIKDCKEGLEPIKKEFALMEFENTAYYWMDHPAHRKAVLDLQLLPVYDEYIMGYKDRSAILQFKNRIAYGSSFWFDSMITWKGQVIGTWKRNLGKKQIELQFKLFIDLKSQQMKAFEKMVDFFGSYYHLPVIRREIK